jgi:hypothetical protein
MVARIPGSAGIRETLPDYPLCAVCFLITRTQEVSDARTSEPAAGTTAANLYRPDAATRGGVHGSAVLAAHSGLTCAVEWSVHPRVSGCGPA